MNQIIERKKDMFNKIVPSIVLALSVLQAQTGNIKDGINRLT